MEGGGSTGSSARRETLKKRLFKKCDKDCDGALKQGEMRELAALVGFEGTDDEWMQEYEKLCQEQNVALAGGIPQAIVMVLLDDDSDNGCYCTDAELQELVAGDHLGPDLRPEPHAKDNAKGDAAGKGARDLAKGKGSQNNAKALADCDSSCKVFFAGANFDTEEVTLKRIFSEAGKVEEFVLFRMQDNRSRGMGVVMFSTPDEARSAITDLHKREVDGRSLLVQEDTKRGPVPEAGVRKQGRNARWDAQGEEWPGAKGDPWHEEWPGAKGGQYESDRQWIANQWAEGPSGKGKGNGKGWKGKEAGWDGGKDRGWGKDGGKGGGKKGRHDDFGYGKGQWYEEEEYAGDIVDYYGYDTDGYTVFFAGASFDTTSNHLRKLFAEGGRILQFWLFQLPDGRSRGMGCVQYERQTEAAYAIEIMHTRVVDGRSILVKIDDVGAMASEGMGYAGGVVDRRGGKGGQWGGGGKGRNHREPSWTNRVFFAGAPFHCTEGTLRSYFAELGVIRSFTVFWLNDGRHRGMGVCTYSTNAEAEDVLAKGITVEGRPLFLQEDTSQYNAEGGAPPPPGRASQQALPYGTSESSSYGPNHERKQRRSSLYDHDYDAYNFGAYNITVDPLKAVFFANVPFETTETHLRGRFASAGKVVHLILFMNTEGKSRGMGIVEYASQAGAIRAYNTLHESYVSGRQIVVDEYRPPHQ